MHISTMIEVSGSTYPYTAEQAATQVLAALGGNPAKDTSTARISFHKLQITTDVQLGSGDSFLYTPDAAATQVLAALAGNPTTDYAVVVVMMPATQGQAGVAPA